MRRGRREGGGGRGEEKEGEGDEGRKCEWEKKMGGVLITAGERREEGRRRKGRERE